MTQRSKLTFPWMKEPAEEEFEMRAPRVCKRELFMAEEPGADRKEADS